MKRFTCLAVLSVVVALAGCGNSNSNSEYVEVEIEKIDTVQTVNTNQNVDDSNIEDFSAGVDSILLDEGYENPGTEDIFIPEDISKKEEQETDTVNVDNEEQSDESAVDYEKDPSCYYVAVAGDTASEILEAAKEELNWQNVKLEIVKVDSVNAANDLVLSGKADANFCLNKAYMDSYNTIHGSDLTIVQQAFYEPIGIYPGKSSSLGKCPSGAVFGVPQGDLNIARSLYLLAQKGIIELKEGVSFQACVDDIISNPHNIKIETFDVTAGKPGDAAYDYYLMDMNYAIIYGLDNKSVLGYENRNSQLLDLFTINLVTKSSNKDNARLQTLIKVLDGDKVSSFIKNTYMGSVVDYK